MAGKISTERAKRLIRRLLEDPELRAYVRAELSKDFAEKEKTEDRIEKLYEQILKVREEGEKRWREWMEKYEREREEDRKRWEQYEKEREEDRKRWQEWMERYEREREEDRKRWEQYEKEREEDRKRWQEWMERYEREREEDRKRWEQYEKEREEDRKRWEQYEKDREENNKRWEEVYKILDEHSKHIQNLYEEVKKLYKLYNTSIGAIGARWGYMSEHAFREALKALLEKDFGVEVQRYLKRDREGFVFGRPDQVELDIIIKNGKVIIAEIKSSMSKADVYAFLRKVEFYKKEEGREVDRLMIISPMVDPKAQAVAEANGIEIYSYPEEL